jgi:recombinational DNA repair protein (RecF pathway)
MSYAVYTTTGWVLSSAPSGEASRIYSIYTEDFGLIHAKAQGVRLLASKLRYNVEDYSLAVFSFVRGKEIWRLTGAEKLAVPEKQSMLRARVLNLVRRLVQGEERNETLFAALSCLREESVSEISILSRVLSALGYLDLSSLSGKSDRESIALINKALKETQL